MLLSKLDTKCIPGRLGWVTEDMIINLEIRNINLM
jgi:hypothetical protein